MSIAINILQANLEVPFQLERIQTSDAWVIGVALFTAFLLIALAQRMDPVILKATGLTLFNLSTREELESNDIQLDSYGYLMLSISFLFSFGICVFEWVDNSTLLVENQKWVAMLGGQTWKILLAGMCASLLLMIYPFIGMQIGAWLTGEKAIFQMARQQTWISLQFLSLVTFVIALLWFLNPVFSSVFQQYIPWLVVCLFLVRFMKCFNVAWANGVAWYYIILYFLFSTIQ